MVRTKQAGGVAGFIIIGGILVLLASGALYMATHVINNKSAPTPVSSPEVTLPGFDEIDKTPTTNDERQDKTSTTPGSLKSTDKTSPQKADNKRKQGVSSSSGSVELSHTGPATDALVRLLMLGVLVGVTVSFICSRRTSASL